MMRMETRRGEHIDSAPCPFKIAEKTHRGNFNAGISGEAFNR